MTDAPETPKPALNIPAIVERAGGAAAIAEQIAAETGKKFTADAIRKWPIIGIPDRHWPTIMRLSGVTAEELFAANVAARTPEQARAGEAA